MKSIREAPVSGKRVLVRCDLDVPLRRSKIKNQKSKILDDFRIRVCLPTLEYLLENGAQVTVMGHLDRPKGKVVEELRMNPVADFINKHLEQEISMLENLRFDPREKSNDKGFAKELADLGDIYVNEAFAVCHRKHASVVGITEYLPSYAGLRLEEEVKKLTQVKESPRRPLVFIIGGAKTKTKVPLVKKVAKYADKILLGGKLMFEQSLEDIPHVLFPPDAVDIYDVGPKTVEMFKKELSKAKIVVWNGPLGKFENAKYAKGTRTIADYLTRIDTEIVVGGGDTLLALKKFGLRKKMDFCSTGGGAMLSFLAGDNLPGLEALK